MSINVQVCQPRIGIKDIPLEIINIIFVHASDYENLELWEYSVRKCNSNNVLRDLSLTCRDFTAPAQRLLLHSVNITTKSRLKELVSLFKKKSGPRSSFLKKMDYIKRVTLSCFGSGKASTTKSTVKSVLQHLPHIRYLYIDAGNSTQVTFDLLGLLQVIRTDGPKSPFAFKLRLPTLLHTYISEKDAINRCLSELSSVSSLFGVNWPDGLAILNMNASISLSSITLQKCGSPLKILSSISQINPTLRLKEINLSIDQFEYAQSSLPKTIASLDISNLRTFRFHLGGQWVDIVGCDLGDIKEMVYILKERAAQLTILELNGFYILEGASTRFPIPIMKQILEAIPPQIVSLGMGCQTIFKPITFRATSLRKQRTGRTVQISRVEAFRNNIAIISLPNLRELDFMLNVHNNPPDHYKPLEKLCQERSILFNTHKTLFYDRID